MLGLAAWYEQETTMAGTPDGALAGLPESPFLATQETDRGAAKAIDSDPPGLDKTSPKMDATQESKTNKAGTAGQSDELESTSTASEENVVPVMASKDWQILPRRSQRWSNPEDWEFKILKFGNYFSPNSFKMAAKLLGSGESESTKRFEDFDALSKFPSGQNQMQILWIGHATLLVQMGGKNILTDPVFSNKVGPNWGMGYKRYRVPAVAIHELEEKGIQIHVVVISHNHFDHLDEVSIRALNKSYDKIKWCVPMDLAATLTSWGCPAENVKEYKWWEKGDMDDLTIRFTPAKHWSGRGTFDWYKTLWGSWIIKTKELTFFFAGDTGYQKELFEAIKQEFPSIDVAAIPIGAYEPRKMLECQHINPEEAVKIHKDLGIKLSVGIHWRTFQLSTETVDQTQKDLKAAIKSQEVDESTFITLEDDLIMRYPAEAPMGAEAPKGVEALKQQVVQSPFSTDEAEGQDRQSLESPD